ncbi:MAG TPA: SRPBCC family protein [Gaiellales bacterium]|jgi:hypothetical protein|nr:SRPBCC family protein [Gaiellales bacterium]
MSELPAPARSVTQSVTIDRSAHDVYAFLSDAANWPRWAVVNVLAAEPGNEPGWWRIATPDGPGEIRIRADAATGVLDHDFRDPQEPGWMATVPARVVANGRGADFVMTIFQPPELEDEAFDRWLSVTTTEFSKLREVLEHDEARGSSRDHR